MEELYETEVLWPNSDDCRPTGASAGRVSSKTEARARGCSTTAALAIPNRVSTSLGWGVGREENKDNDNDDDYEDDTEFTPPHILTSRNSGSGGGGGGGGGGGSGSATKVAFSLCSGQGRTLKGRDLSYVRNSVLRMTGFLET